MQFSVEDVSPVEKKVAVEVEWPIVSAKLDAAYKELGRDVALKGFRKGKVPRNILEKMFARRVEEEVVRQLIQESFVQAAQKHSIQPVAEPIVDDVHLHKGEKFHYTARVEVRAEVEPKEYEGIPLDKHEPEIAAEEIDRALERKREELAQFKPIEGRAILEKSDIVICEVRGEVADKPFHRDTLVVDLGQPQRDPINGLSAALIGKPVVSAEPHMVELDMPDSGGKKALLKVTVKEAREKHVPALDDDFAKDTGEADTLEELRGKVREQLLGEKGKDVDRELKAGLVKELIRRNPFEVAPSLIERQTDVVLQRTKFQMAMQGVDVRQGFDDTRIKDSLRSAAADEVRAMLLLDAIATKEKVEISEADLEKRMAEMAKSRETSVPRLKAELQKEGRYEGIRHSLREEKTLDLLLSKAIITPSKEAASPSEK